MFSQRKRFYERKSFYGIILALLLAFGFWVNADPGDEGQKNVKDPVVSTGEQVPSKQDGDEDGSGNHSSKYDSSSDRDSNSYYADRYGDDSNGYTTENGTDDDPYDVANGNDPSDYGDEDQGPEGTDPAYEENENGSERSSGAYYLLKEDGGYIKLYSVGESGKRQLLRTTDISFSLLSEGDQELFEKGIVKQTKDELSDLLQDFES